MIKDAIKKILIVEDEAVIAMALAAELEDAGFEILDISPTGEEALALLRQQAADLVILDVKLGNGMDGLDTMLEIRKSQSPYIFIVSGNSDTPTAQRIKEMSVDGFFVKPVNVQVLLKRVLEINGKPEES